MDLLVPLPAEQDKSPAESTVQPPIFNTELDCPLMCDIVENPIFAVPDELDLSAINVDPDAVH